MQSYHSFSFSWCYMSEGNSVGISQISTNSINCQLQTKQHRWTVFFISTVLQEQPQTLLVQDRQYSESNSKVIVSINSKSKDQLHTVMNTYLTTHIIICVIIKQTTDRRHVPALVHKPNLERVHFSSVMHQLKQLSRNQLLKIMSRF